MIKVYAVSLAIGIILLIVVLYGGTLAENLGRSERDPGERYGTRGKQVIGALLGFGMGGMSAEYSPIDFDWPVSLLVALVAAVLSALWVHYSVTSTNVQ